MGNIQSISYFIPELIVTATVLVAVVADLFTSTRKVHKIGYLVIGGLAIAAFALWLSSPEDSSTLFLGTIVIDPFSRIFKFIFLLATIVAVMMSLNSDELNSVRTGEYYALMAAMVLGMSLMASSVDLIMIYLSIEVVSIVSFILAGYLRTQVRSNEAALKYVIYGAFSSGLMLYGLSLLYGLTGTTKVLELGSAVAALGPGSDLPLTAATILIMAGFGYKVAVVPFHFWTPDVYEGAPTPVTAYLSVAPKAAGFALLIRFFNSVFGEEQPLNGAVWEAIEGVPWQDILMVLAAVTMTVGNLIAIQQDNIKRLLAYSSIAHAGYILMAVPVLSQEGIYAIIFYIIVYLFMQLGAFFLAIVVSNRYETENIDDYSGIGWKSPYIGFFMAIFMFSLTGIPPTAGFIGKMYLFAALINGGSQFYWLAIVGVLNSVISLYYYMRVIKVMYFEGEREKDLYRPVGASAAIILATGIPSIIFGIRWSFLADWVNSSLKFFVSGF
ncbi:MAG: NADH-quinone oxidoreductase subunit N [Candidatus Marinimicrobia bacterium]|nr:NADH-quinone oxidoreductase subunit N [Candidatus Neomarinimicrobiota bacterium]|tara:strand:- start:11068 stop:12561 length:1494 start_codon:yes stop_codon:yes gene_type:complete